jgi:hypothetical protein
MFYIIVSWGGGETDKWAHLVRRPLTGLLYQPRAMSMEQSVEWELAGEIKVLGENLPQRHYIQYELYVTWPGLEPGAPRWEAGD